MPYTDVMLLSAQPQHKKWRKLPYHSQPLPTIQARGQLATYVPDLELANVTATRLPELPEREVPMATLNSDQFNCFKTVVIPGVSRSPSMAGARPNAGSVRSSPAVTFEPTLQNSLRCMRAR